MLYRLGWQRGCGSLAIYAEHVRDRVLKDAADVVLEGDRVRIRSLTIGLDEY